MTPCFLQNNLQQKLSWCLYLLDLSMVFVPKLSIEKRRGFIRHDYAANNHRIAAIPTATSR